MPGHLQRDLIGGDFIVERLRVFFGFGVELGQIESGALRRARQMIAQMPVARAAPDQLRRFMRERQNSCSGATPPAPAG